MLIEKIKPIPKYIAEKIKKLDDKMNREKPGVTRYYSYLTKNDGELVKVTVAVKYYRKQWLYKQVAVHGIHSEDCFVKDMVFYYIGGYQTGWYSEGGNRNKKWYEGEWGWSEDTTHLIHKVMNTENTLARLSSMISSESYSNLVDMINEMGLELMDVTLA